MEVDWVPISLSRAASCGKGTSHYLLPGDIPKTYGLYVIGYELMPVCNDSAQASSQADESNLPQSENGAHKTTDRTGANVTYCYLGIAEERTLQQSLFQHFQGSGRHAAHGEAAAYAIYIKFVEVELDFLSAGSLLECVETAVGYPLEFNNKEPQ
ncbi:hypothetical protein WMY93_007789 [Mugilogobius chulae]|uniref:Uncharacterized protein n=1 Tax=Mugilogobius chulae TaxID=88201 RepID=A0AAW0PKI4_9GOBI